MIESVLSIKIVACSRECTRNVIIFPTNHTSPPQILFHRVKLKSLLYPHLTLDHPTCFFRDAWLSNVFLLGGMNMNRLVIGAIIPIHSEFVHVCLASLHHNPLLYISYFIHHLIILYHHIYLYSYYKKLKFHRTLIIYFILSSQAKYLA